MNIDFLLYFCIEKFCRSVQIALLENNYNYNI